MDIYGSLMDIYDLKINIYICASRLVLVKNGHQ